MISKEYGESFERPLDALDLGSQVAALVVDGQHHADVELVLHHLAYRGHVVDRPGARQVTGERTRRGERAFEPSLND